MKWGIAALLLCSMGCVLAAQDQSSEMELAFKEVPFEQWVLEGPKEQLPWRTHIFGPKLSQHQRIWTRIQIDVDGNELLKRCCEGRATALLEITDAEGHAYRNYGTEDLKEVKPGLRAYVVTLSWDAFVLPGEYKVALGFYYSGREGHSFAIERLHVGGMRNDPLAGSWNGLPNVEFCDPRPEGYDEAWLPGVQGRLHLGITTRRPVRLEVLGNLTPYLVEQRRPTLYKDRLKTFLPILKTLGQLDLPGGSSLNLAILDFTRNRVTFEQDAVKEGRVDWEGLKEALAANVMAAIDVHDIRKSEQYGIFFREEMLRRLAARKEADESALRVFVIISGEMQFGFGRPPVISRPPGGNIVVYYVRYESMLSPDAISNVTRNPGSQESFEPMDDGIGKALKELNPRVFAVRSPEGVRKALAAILSEVSHM